MLTLHSIQLAMLVVATLLLLAPRWFNKTGKSKAGIIASIFLVIFSVGCYFVSYDRGLPQWFAYGEEHYFLQQKLNDLGGVDSIIAQIKQRLANNPDDTAGWNILGKLYLSQQNYPAAKAAFAKAKHLSPDHP